MKDKANPVRYSTALLLVLTACLYCTQRYPLGILHGDLLDSNYMVGEMQGAVSRQIAFLTLGCAGIAGIRHVLTRRREDVARNTSLIVAAAVLLIWCVISLSWSNMPLVAAKRFVVVALMFLSGVGFALSWTREEVLKFIALSSALYLTAGVAVEIGGGYFTPLSGVYRFSGTLFPNEEGYLCMALVISSVCMVRTRAMQRAVSLLYRFLACYGLLFLLLTRSRGALIALGITCFLYFFAVLDLHKKVLTCLLLATTALVATVVGALPNLVDLLTRGGQGNEDFTGRIPLWNELMEYVQQRPLLGRGYESFWTAATIDDVFKHQHWAVNQAHSEYIECMLTIGIVGMVFHTLVLLMGMIEGIRLFRSTQDIVFFLAASFCFIYLVGGSLEALLVIKPSIVTFYLILLLCLLMVSQKGASTGKEAVAGVSRIGPWTQNTSTY